jgi:hypothetical protein
MRRLLFGAKKHRSLSHRCLSVISSKYNPTANKYEEEVRKCIANVSHNHLFIIHYYIHSFNYLKVKEIVTNNSILSLGCISSVKIQDNNVSVDLDLMIAGYPHRYILIIYSTSFSLS